MFVECSEESGIVKNITSCEECVDKCQKKKCVFVPKESDIRIKALSLIKNNTGFVECRREDDGKVYVECSEESEIKKNISSWLSNQTDPYILDPHLCQDSCQSPGQHCDACSDDKYPRCTKDGVTVCYHPDLWCDGHPLCDAAADEPIEIRACQRKLINRGQFLFEYRHLTLNIFLIRSNFKEIHITMREQTLSWYVFYLFHVVSRDY